MISSEKKIKPRWPGLRKVGSLLNCVDFARRSDNLASMIDSVEKSLTAYIQKHVNELEQVLMSLRERVETVYEGATNMLEQVNLRLKSVDETAKVKNWLMLIIDEQLIQTKKEVVHGLYEQAEKVEAVKSWFNVPGVIGQGCRYPSVKDYIEDTFYQNRSQFVQIDRKLEDLEGN